MIKYPQSSSKGVARAIIDYVKNSYKWDGFYGIYSSKSPKDFISQKTGNSTDINLFLVSMLRAAGIDAQPVLSSTRDHGKINSKYPFLHYFNYVLVLVNIPEGAFLCDGTDTHTRFDRIPARCINDRGLIIKNDGENWLSLNTGVISVDEKNLIFEISPEKLNAKVIMNIQTSEYDALYYKRTFENDTVKLKKHLNELGLTTVSKISTFNYSENEKPYIIICTAETEIEQLDNKLIISPYLNLYQNENKLTQPTRTYPIDFTYANTEAIRCKIKIPAGYKVFSLPESFSFESDLVKISTSYKAEGDLIEMDCSYGFKKAVYPPTEYRNIKLYFDMIIKRFHEQIVLEKV